MVADLAAHHRQRRAADLDRDVIHDAAERRAHEAALELGLGRGQRRLGGRELRLEIDQLELRHRARRDQLALGFELGPALDHQRLRLRHLRLARVVGEHGDDVAFLHAGAAAHAQLGQHAARARGHDHATVGLGAAREHELAGVIDHLRLDDGDAERLLGRGFAANRRAAVPRFRAAGSVRTRSTVPRRRPGRPRRYDLLSSRPLLGANAIVGAATQHVTRDIHENRQQRLGVECRIERAAPPHAVGDDHQHGRRRRRSRDRARCRRDRRRRAEDRSAISSRRRRTPAEMRAISGWRRASDMISVQSLHLLVRPLGEMVVGHAFEHREKSAARGRRWRIPARPRRDRARRCRRSAPPSRGSSGRDCPGSCRPRCRCPASTPHGSPSARSSAGPRRGSPTGGRTWPAAVWPWRACSRPAWPRFGRVAWWLAPEILHSSNLRMNVHSQDLERVSTPAQYPDFDCCTAPNADLRMSPSSSTTPRIPTTARPGIPRCRQGIRWPLSRSLRRRCMRLRERAFRSP